MGAYHNLSAEGQQRLAHLRETWNACDCQDAQAMRSISLQDI